jgi:hypothetical protein
VILEGEPTAAGADVTGQAAGEARTPGASTGATRLSAASGELLLGDSHRRHLLLVEILQDPPSVLCGGIWQVSGDLDVRP